MLAIWFHQVAQYGEEHGEGGQALEAVIDVEMLCGLVQHDDADENLGFGGLQLTVEGGDLEAGVGAEVVRFGIRVRFGFRVDAKLTESCDQVLQQGGLLILFPAIVALHASRFE